MPRHWWLHVLVLIPLLRMLGMEMRRYGVCVRMRLLIAVVGMTVWDRGR